MASEEDSIKVALLVRFVKEGNLAAIKHLVEKGGVNINSRDVNGQNVLCSAVLSGRKSIVAYLLSKGAKVDFPIESDCIRLNGSTPLYFATRLGYINICKLLLEHGADPNFYSRQERILDAAIWSDKPELIGLILRKSSHSIDDHGPLGMTSLMVALVNGRRNSVEFLLQMGADYNKLSVGGSAPLELCLQIKPIGVSCLELLLEFVKSREGNDGVSKYVNRINPKSNQTVLHIAYSYRRMNEIDILLKYGADPNTKDSEGRIPGELLGRGLSRLRMEELWQELDSYFGRLTLRELNRRARELFGPSHDLFFM